MANHSWTFDAPSGVYKNHKLSADIREASVVQSLFMQFVSPEAGYGKRNGESVTIARIGNVAVPSSSLLTEGVRISEDSISLSTQAVTVAENGRAIPFNSFATDLAFFDLESKVQKKLMQQMKISMDRACATAAKAGKVKAIPDGVSSLVFDTDGTPSTTALANLNVYHVEQIRDYAFTTLNIMPAVGDDYIFMVSTKAKRGIMSDPAWVDWKKYTDPEAKFNSEVGRLENCRFIEVNDTTSLSGSKGSGSVLGEGVLLGEDALAMAVAQDPELRAKIPEDYGRSKGVAWYGIYGFAQIWSDSANQGEARVIHLTSQ